LTFSKRIERSEHEQLRSSGTLAAGGIFFKVIRLVRSQLSEFTNPTMHMSKDVEDTSGGQRADAGPRLLMLTSFDSPGTAKCAIRSPNVPLDRIVFSYFGVKKSFFDAEKLFFGAKMLVSGAGEICLKPEMAHSRVETTR